MPTGNEGPNQPGVATRGHQERPTARGCDHGGCDAIGWPAVLSPFLRVDVIADDRSTVLVVRGELEADTAPLLERWLADHVFVGGASGDVVVDLSGAEFISVLGVGVLVGAARRAQEDRRRLLLASPSPLARRVLELLQLTEILPVTPGSTVGGGRSAAGAADSPTG